jgi:hypothetical protein
MKWTDIWHFMSEMCNQSNTGLTDKCNIEFVYKWDKLWILNKDCLQFLCVI